MDVHFHRLTTSRNKLLRIMGGSTSAKFSLKVAHIQAKWLVHNWKISSTSILLKLSDILFLKAVQKFSPNKNVHLLKGDSSVVLQILLEEIHESALFWLDGHYSAGITARGIKECPIVEELTTILHHSFLHTILIDDARLFVGQNDYPSIEDLKSLVMENCRTIREFLVKDDIIRIVM